MIDIMPDDKEISKALNVLNSISDKLIFCEEKRMDFNSYAESHPCMKCEHGAVWREQSKPAGNVCKHPEICKRKGLYYGRYHTLKKVPAWCPFKQES